MYQPTNNRPCNPPNTDWDTAARKLRPPAAADYLSLSASTLAKMRVRGDGPPYSKAGSRIVVYDINDLDQWLDARKVRSTSEVVS